ncbi:MAG: hypothetical protein AAB214_15495 [Fibrobacterota bacterium]
MIDSPNDAASDPIGVLPIDGTCVVWNDNLERLPESGEIFDGIRRVGDRVELEIEGIARYHIVGGSSIEVRVDPVSDRETAWFFLKATPFGILILQRGELPLHAAALVPPGGGKALLVAGESGAGKSTTSAILAQRGWTLLNDDISRIVFAEGVPVVCPGFQSLKLNADSLALLGLDMSSAPRTRGFKEKYYWHLSGGHFACPVGAMIVLDDPHGEPPTPGRLSGLELFREFYRQTFRPYLVVPLGYQKEHFRQISKLAGAVPCHCISGVAKRTPADIESLALRLAQESVMVPNLAERRSLP